VIARGKPLSLKTPKGASLTKVRGPRRVMLDFGRYFKNNT